MAETQHIVPSLMRPSADADVRVNVAITPAFLDERFRIGNITSPVVYIVVDVIRATTTLCVLFEQGCRRVLVAPSIEGARAAHQEMHDALLAGESEGIAPQGFDFGNSPSEFAQRDLQTRDLIFATTNGTRALRACAGGIILAGSFRNARGVARAAVKLALRTPDTENQKTSNAPSVRPMNGGGASEAEGTDTQSNIVIVCSGRGGKPAYDDTICAGYLVREIELVAGELGSACEIQEGARIARDLSQCINQGSHTRTEALAISDAGRAIERVGLSADLRWCADVDATEIVPVVTGTTAHDLLIMEPLTDIERI